MIKHFLNFQTFSKYLFNVLFDMTSAAGEGRCTTGLESTVRQSHLQIIFRLSLLCRATTLCYLTAPSYLLNLQSQCRSPSNTQFWQSDICDFFMRIWPKIKLQLIHHVQNFALVFPAQKYKVDDFLCSLSVIWTISNFSILFHCCLIN